MYFPIDTICVIGLGYIGLPTASILATKGFKVFGCDVNANVVETINRGDIHIIEQGLDILVRSAIMSGQLSASTTPKSADVYIIAVPTPFKDNHVPDVSYIESATRAIAEYIEPGALIILESTSPVGTTEQIAEWLAKLRPDLAISSRHNLVSDTNPNRIYIAHCPERVLPGHILRELVENDRIIGGIDRPSAEKAQAFYEAFVEGDIFLTDARTAEMAKLTENAFRDVNIAFANELSIICEQLSINVWELIRLANHHPRVNILQPGPGVGGHCIAVDPWFIVDAAPQCSNLIHTARLVNDKMPEIILLRIAEKAARFNQPVIACLGLAFKANIDDLRESPALQITKELVCRDIAEVLVVEPYINQLPKSLQSTTANVVLMEMHEAIVKADIIVLLVDHKEFAQIDKSLLNEKVVIDTRGLWEKHTESSAIDNYSRKEGKTFA